MDALNFAQPELFWLLGGVVALVAWMTAQHVGFAARLHDLGTGPVVQRLVANWSSRKSIWRIVLTGIALALAVTALTRPRYGVRETEVSNAGIDIALVVDASKSMLVKDVVPNRLQGTALEISGLLNRLAGGRVALVPFAGIAFTQCPLTTDHDVIRTYLADLKPEDVPVGGTNIGRAITQAMDVLTGEQEHTRAEATDNLMPQFKGSKNKAIILFSDGEDHEGAAIEAAQKAAAAGIKIYTVGVGSAFGDPVPVLGPDGVANGVQKDEKGDPIFSKLNMALLDQIAATTGGKSFHYANQSVAPQLFAALDALEKAEYTAQFKMLGEDRYQYLLGPAILLLLIDTALGTRRQGKRRRKLVAGPAQKLGASAAAIAALVAILGAIGCVFAPRSAMAVPRWLQHENSDMAAGRRALEEQKFGEALKSFEEVRRTRPEHVIIWYNLGLAQAALGLHQDAVTSFSRALGGMRERNRALEADVHYATGTAQLDWARKLEAQAAAQDQGKEAKDGKDGKKPDNAKPNQPDKAPAKDTDAEPKAAPAAPVDPLPHYRSAVTSLEQALLAAPDRIETKRNLEIARLGAWPPCRSRDKANEPNDQLAQATPLTFAADQREQTLDLRACPEDRDLFKVALQPGDRFSASVKTKADTTAAAESEDALAGAPAKLGLWLLKDDGRTILRGAQDREPPTDAADLGKVDRNETVIVDVRNIAEVEAAYDLTLKLLPGCHRLEDKYEPNDSPVAAKQIAVGEPIKGRLCPMNDDHFGVSLQVGQGLAIKAKTKVDIGSDKVEIAILDGQGQIVAQGRQGKEGLVARLAYAQELGIYVVQIRGALDTEADYELAMAILPACTQRDDAWEDNDQALQANPLGAPQLQSPMEQLQLCPGDDDWYAVEIKQGESLFVDLSAKIEEFPDAQDLAGSLTVEVYDDKGTLWGQAIGNAAAGAQAIVRTVAVLEPPPGTYRVRVTGGGVQGPSFPLPPLPPGSVQMSEPVATQPPGSIGQPPDPSQMPPGPGQPPPPQPGQAQGQAPPPPPPIPHVILPPNTAVPLVNRAQAKLDVPYSLKLRILPPCPDGNDEFEPNNSAAESKPVQVGSEQLMRICKGDQDWLQIAQKAGQNLQVTARYDLSHGPLEMTAYDEAGTKELVKGQRVEPDGKKRAENQGDDTPAARKGRTATTGLQIKGEKADRTVKLRLWAEKDGQNFYVLRIEEPPPPSDKDNKDKQDDEKKDDKKDEEKKKDDKKKEEPKKPEEKPDTAQLKQQMERNDHNPTNLEAQEALRKSQFRNATPAKDW